MLAAAAVVLFMVAIAAIDAPGLLRRGERRTILAYIAAWLVATGFSAAYAAGVRLPNPTLWIVAGTRKLNELLGLSAFWQ